AIDGIACRTRGRLARESLARNGPHARLDLRKHLRHLFRALVLEGLNPAFSPAHVLAVAEIDNEKRGGLPRLARKAENLPIGPLLIGEGHRERHASVLINSATRANPSCSRSVSVPMPKRRCPSSPNQSPATTKTLFSIRSRSTSAEELISASYRAKAM